MSAGGCPTLLEGAVKRRHTQGEEHSTTSTCSSLCLRAVSVAQRFFLFRTRQQTCNFSFGALGLTLRSSGRLPATAYFGFPNLLLVLWAIGPGSVFTVPTGAPSRCLIRPLLVGTAHTVFRSCFQSTHAARAASPFPLCLASLLRLGAWLLRRG